MSHLTKTSSVVNLNLNIISRLNIELTELTLKYPPEQILVKANFLIPFYFLSIYDKHTDLLYQDLKYLSEEPHLTTIAEITGYEKPYIKATLLSIPVLEMKNVIVSVGDVNIPGVEYKKYNLANYSRNHLSSCRMIHPISDRHFDMIMDCFNIKSGISQIIRSLSSKYRITIGNLERLWKSQYQQIYEKNRNQRLNFGKKRLALEDSDEKEPQPSQPSQPQPPTLSAESSTNRKKLKLTIPISHFQPIVNLSTRRGQEMESNQSFETPSNSFNFPNIRRSSEELEKDRILQSLKETERRKEKEDTTMDSPLSSPYSIIDLTANDTIFSNSVHDSNTININSFNNNNNVQHFVKLEKSIESLRNDFQQFKESTTSDLSNIFKILNNIEQILNNNKKTNNSNNSNNNSNSNIIRKVEHPNSQSDTSTPYFLFSGFSKEGKFYEMLSVIQDLGGILQDRFMPGVTTHLISKSPIKSEKFMCSCAAGVWVLAPSYLDEVVEKKVLVPEGPHEWNQSKITSDIDMSLSQLWIMAPFKCRMAINNKQKLLFQDCWIATSPKNINQWYSWALILKSGGANIVECNTPSDVMSTTKPITHYFINCTQNKSAFEILLEKTCFSMYSNCITIDQKLIINHLINGKHLQPKK
ncbi:hypothetical protein DLAC_08423 [Tieghemostelium lacteum]|uniref:BRCT domain-containing protein n=1 Tax=Tieghemostelium lacteum TaxID=361077 RepID=A0A151ZBY3_TIELA|nr:hypothetical protein DLAC_08423 [Tieghemostelium lacteum]|eukprot:KYQ91456.1 hypothetical protein DLAC_08423 [Tieghemostelium lacteum]